MEFCAKGEHANSVQHHRTLDTEIVMKHKLVKLGSASVVTRDWTGDFVWDGLVYQYQKRYPWG
jgi:hypothetical protein